MLVMVHKYGAADGADASAAFKRAVLANANRGGENVATGALIGALLGAECGFSKLPRGLVAGLAPSQRAVIQEEVDAFVAASPFVAAAKSGL